MRDVHSKRYAPGRGSHPGPSTVDQLREGDRYELTQGHPIYVAPTGLDGALGVLAGGPVINSDPQVKAAAVDAGCVLDDRTLRAPDIAVGDLPDTSGWMKGAPALAVEYAGSGQDEADLQLKIKELLAAGTRFVWVVRLLGIRRVEIYEPEKPMRVAHVGQDLVAPGVLQNPIPVQAMFDRELAHKLTLRNLLQRDGYRDLDAVREEGHQRGLEEGHQRGLEEGHQRGLEEGHQQGLEEGLEALRGALRSILRARGFALGPAELGRISSCRDLGFLERWIGRAATARTAVEVLE
jgi:Uma2 family endonuclease